MTKIYPEWRAIAPAEYVSKFGGVDRLCLERSIDEMTQVTDTNTGKHRVRVELIEPWSHSTTANSPFTMVRHMPFGNSASSPNQRFQSWFLAQALDVPVVSVSAPSYGSRYRLPMGQMLEGDLTCYAQQAHEAVRSLDRTLGALAFMGWSSGATTGLAHAIVAAEQGSQVAWVVAGDPVNTKPRSPLELAQDVGEAGWKQLFATLERTGLHSVFMKAYGLDGKKESQEAKAFAAAMNRRAGVEFTFALWQKMKVAVGLGKASLRWQIDKALQKNIPVVVAHGAQSTMCTQKDLDVQLQYGIDRNANAGTHLYPITLSDADHTHGDFVHAMAHLGTLARNIAVGVGRIPF